MDSLTRTVLGCLSPEQKATAIAYVDTRLVRAGSIVDMGGQRLEAPWDSFVAFVDLEPGVNWGHRCLYVLVRDGFDTARAVQAQMPPFLKAPVPTLRVIWKGPRAPDWAVATGD